MAEGAGRRGHAFVHDQARKTPPQPLSGEGWPNLSTAPPTSPFQTTHTPQTTPPQTTRPKLKTPIRPGLLVDIVSVLKDINVNVVSAEIDTIGGEARDELFVTYHGEPLSGPMTQLVTNALQVGGAGFWGVGGGGEVGVLGWADAVARGRL